MPQRETISFHWKFCISIDWVSSPSINSGLTLKSFDLTEISIGLPIDREYMTAWGIFNYLLITLRAETNEARQINITTNGGSESCSSMHALMQKTSSSRLVSIKNLQTLQLGKELQKFLTSCWSFVSWFSRVNGILTLRILWTPRESWRSLCN